MKMKILYLQLFIFNVLNVFGQGFYTSDNISILPGTQIFEDQQLRKHKATIFGITNAIIVESEKTDFYGITFKQYDKVNTGYVSKSKIPKQLLKLSSDQTLVLFSPDPNTYPSFDTSLKLIANDKVLEIKNFGNQSLYFNSKLELIKINVNGLETHVIQLHLQPHDTCASFHSYYYYKYINGELLPLRDFHFERSEMTEPTYVMQFPHDPFGEEGKLVWLKIDYQFNAEFPCQLKNKIFSIIEEIEL